MPTFGEALKAIQGKRKNVHVADVALGEGASKKKRRDFAAYLGKFHKDKVPSPGLEQLRAIAKGLGYEQLSAFFQDIEREMTSPGTRKSDTDRASKSPAEPKERVHNGRTLQSSRVVVRSDIYAIFKRISIVASEIALAFGDEPAAAQPRSVSKTRA